MANPITLPSDLRGLVLSASEVYNLTGWPDPMIEDYLTLIENLIILSDAINAKQDILRTVVNVDFSMSPYDIADVDQTLVFDTTLGNIVANLPAGITTLSDGSEASGRTYRMTNIGTAGNRVELFPDGADLLFGDVTENIYDAETLIMTYGDPDGWW